MFIAKTDQHHIRDVWNFDSFLALYILFHLLENKSMINWLFENYTQWTEY